MQGIHELSFRLDAFQKTSNWCSSFGCKLTVSSLSIIFKFLSLPHEFRVWVFHVNTKPHKTTLITIKCFRWTCNFLLDRTLFQRISNETLQLSIYSKISDKNFMGCAMICNPKQSSCNFKFFAIFPRNQNASRSALWGVLFAIWSRSAAIYFTWFNQECKKGNFVLCHLIIYLRMLLRK